MAAPKRPAGSPPKGPMGKPPRGVKPQIKNPGKLFKRVMGYVFRKYKFHYITVFVLIFLTVIASVQGTMFTKNLIDDYITPFLLTDTPDPLLKSHFPKRYMEQFL